MIIKRTEKWLKALRLQLPSAITKFGPVASIDDTECSVKTVTTAGGIYLMRNSKNAMD